MTRPHRRHRRRTPPGSPPGTLIADPSAQAPTMRLMRYAPGRLDERVVADIVELGQSVAGDGVAWLDVDGLADVDLVRSVGGLFKVHNLALEDVVNVHQRPKVEVYDDHLFIVTRMPVSPASAETEQVAIFLGANYVLTFQERPGDCFDPVRERIRKGARIRELGADYLAYALIDASIDAYFPVLERHGEVVDELEAEVTSQPDDGMTRRIQGVKRDLLTLRRAIWPQREMVNALIRDESRFVTAQTRLYLRDCYDHVVQLVDILETYREIASGLIDIYLSSVSARMNEIMKLLTIIATIFIPLGFVAGLYGMNFDPSVSPWNMPELGWYWGYPFALGLMTAIGVGLLAFFYRRGWLGRRRRR